MKKKELRDSIRQLSRRVNSLERDYYTLRSTVGGINEHVVGLQNGRLDQPLVGLLANALSGEPLPPPPTTEIYDRNVAYRGADTRERCDCYACDTGDGVCIMGDRDGYAETDVIKESKP